MGWSRKKSEKHAYYSRKRRMNGRRKTEHFGRGPVAQAAAALDSQRAKTRQAETDGQRIIRQLIEAQKAKTAAIDKLREMLVQSRMLDRGFHQHAQGPWRKRRGQKI